MSFGVEYIMKSAPTNEESLDIKRISGWPNLLWIALFQVLTFLKMSLPACHGDLRYCTRCRRNIQTFGEKIITVMKPLAVQYELYLWYFSFYSVIWLSARSLDTVAFHGKERPIAYIHTNQIIYGKSSTLSYVTSSFRANNIIIIAMTLS